MSRYFIKQSAVCIALVITLLGQWLAVPKMVVHGEDFAQVPVWQEGFEATANDWNFSLGTSAEIQMQSTDRVRSGTQSVKVIGGTSSSHVWRRVNFEDTVPKLMTSDCVKVGVWVYIDGEPGLSGSSHVKIDVTPNNTRRGYIAQAAAESADSIKRYLGGGRTDNPPDIGTGNTNTDRASAPYTTTTAGGNFRQWILLETEWFYLPAQVTIDPADPTTQADLTGLTIQLKLQQNVSATVYFDDVSITKRIAPDTTAPTWPVGAEIIVSDVTADSARLTWPLASDEEGVAGYIIYSGMEKYQETTETSLALTGLAQDTYYSFRVTARDAAGNESLPLGPVSVQTQRQDKYDVLIITDGFEGDTAGWSPSTPPEDAAISGEKTHAGGNAMRLTVPSGGASRYMRRTFSVGENKDIQLTDTVRVGAWLWIDKDIQLSSGCARLSIFNNTSANYLASVKIYEDRIISYVAPPGTAVADSVGALPVVSVPDGTLGKWIYVQTPYFTLTPDTTQFRLELKAQQPLAGVIYFDDVEIYVQRETRTTPSWPVGAAVEITGIGKDYAMLSWSAASDESPYLTYNVYADNMKVAEKIVERTHLVSGLTPGQTYTFRIEAVNPVGRISAKLASEPAKTPEVFYEILNFNIFDGAGSAVTTIATGILTAKADVRRLNIAGVKPITVILVHYNANNHVQGINYEVKTMTPGTTGIIAVSLKVTGNVAGHRVKAFIIDDFSNMMLLGET